ncbi:hypothetical protein E2C01_002537 [Portunus trituberculatus]|uniref:Secreted protein n=1 Tax=Portunus trituberculatus TaxID=210409 RepID=A0A5B7CK11_PORTR|nr:hypothetical protein [Portunus trituberculatus]
MLFLFLLSVGALGAADVLNQVEDFLIDLLFLSASGTSYHFCLLCPFDKGFRWPPLSSRGPSPRLLIRPHPPLYLLLLIKHQ